MDSTAQERYGVPFVVRIRAYVPHLLTALFALFAYLLMFAFIAGNAVGAAAELRRAGDAPHNEIVLAGEPNGAESFYYLKNYSVSGEKGKNALSDVLMLMPEADYRDNNIYFRGTLAGGTCAVSANVAAKYGLEVGDNARIMGTNKTFRVAQILPAQDGIDETYKHEGLVVLSYDKDLLDRNYMFMSFMTDGDAYRSLNTLMYVKDMKKDSANDLIFCAAVALFAIAAVMTVSECFIFRARREDYKTHSFLGVPAPRLFGRILAESLLRYALPALIATENFIAWYYPYTDAYYIPVACFTGACILFSTIYSFTVTRSLYYVKSK